MINKIRNWYLANVDKIDFFLIGFALCDLINSIAYYWLKQNILIILWDIFFIGWLLFLRQKEIK